jgi:hypothetical protein
MALNAAADLIQMEIGGTAYQGRSRIDYKGFPAVLGDACTVN